MLMATARAHGANLLVMGGYGHSHMREVIFGGFTQSVLRSADITALDALMSRLIVGWHSSGEGEPD